MNSFDNRIHRKIKLLVLNTRITVLQHHNYQFKLSI